MYRIIERFQGQAPIQGINGTTTQVDVFPIIIMLLGKINSFGKPYYYQDKFVQKNRNNAFAFSEVSTGDIFATSFYCRPQPNLPSQSPTEL